MELSNTPRCRCLRVDGVRGRHRIYQQRLSDPIEPYQGTYGIAYRALQPLLVLVLSCTGTWHIFADDLTMWTPSAAIEMRKN